MRILTVRQNHTRPGPLDETLQCTLYHLYKTHIGRRKRFQPFIPLHLVAFPLPLFPTRDPQRIGQTCITRTNRAF